MDGIELEYWDSCVFLALLQKEPHRDGELQYLEQQARKFDIGALGIVTSSITITEVFEARLSDENKVKFRSMYTRSNFEFFDANVGICQIASEIRGYYKNNPIDGFYPSTPDAIHVASAIAAQSATKNGLLLITFDDENKKKEKEVGLTKMSGLVANKYNLTICRPPIKNMQAGLFQSGN